MMIIKNIIKKISGIPVKIGIENARKEKIHFLYLE